MCCCCFLLTCNVCLFYVADDDELEELLRRRDGPVKGYSGHHRSLGFLCALPSLAVKKLK